MTKNNSFYHTTDYKNNTFSIIKKNFSVAVVFYRFPGGNMQ